MVFGALLLLYAFFTSLWAYSIVYTRDLSALSAVGSSPNTDSPVVSDIYKSILAESVFFGMYIDYHRRR